MPRFATLPSELLPTIFSELSLSNILTVRQVCVAFHEAISTDKLLWMNIFRDYVIGGGICPIPYRRPLSLVSAAAIESWTRNAFLLEKAYLSNNPLSVHCLKTDIRAVTWMKIIRGRWCLAASSNISESRLTLWDISSFDYPICAEILLPGPIMDGEIEDLNSEVIIAVSVGCRERYVQIVTVGTSAGVPKIVKLKAIPGADHVLCLRGSYLGVAVLDGDDSNPILFDWKQDTKWALKPSVPITSLRDADDRAPCLAMTIWDAFVVAAFEMHLRVYTYPERHGVGCELLCTHSFMFCAIEVRFVNNESVAVSFPDGVEGTDATHLHLFFKDCGGECYMQALDTRGQLQGTAVGCDIPAASVDKPTPIQMLSMTIGYTGRKFLGLITTSFLPPRLFIAGMRPSESKTGCDRPSCDNDICTNYHVVPTDDFPLLHFWSCFDFDDSRGVLITGTSRGEICVARFMHRDIVLPGSLIDELPLLQARDVEKTLPVPVMMDLPPYYQFRERIMKDYIPAHVVDQISASWKLPGDIQVSAPGWSSDWRSFENFKHWAKPSLRWGRMDPDMSLPHLVRDSSVNQIRINYGYLGEPSPVVFQQDNHDIVIFRIGSQAFIRRTRYNVALIRQPLHDLSQLLQNITVHEFNDMLHLLSLTWEGTVVDMSDHDFNNMLQLLPLDWRGGYFNTSEHIQIKHMQNFDDILQHVAMSADFELDPDPNNWTYNQWYQVYDCIYAATYNDTEETQSIHDSEAGDIHDDWENDDYWETNECLSVSSEPVISHSERVVPMSATRSEFFISTPAEEAVTQIIEDSTISSTLKQLGI